jgi:hypothetical protein
MLMADAYQGDWQLQQYDSYQGSSRWRIIAPLEPRIEQLVQAQSCVIHQHIADYQWLCATSEGLWMLQREQQQWWLTLWPTQVPAAQTHWLGQIISRQQTELFELKIIDSKFTAHQLIDYSRFKWGQRQPLLREIRHGQFHLQLQQPLEDIFILQLPHSSLLLQFRARKKATRPGYH